MKNLSKYDEINLDTKKDALIDIKSQKDENIPIKSDSTDTSLSDSIDQMNSLIVKEKPVSKNYSSILPINRKGNTYQFFYNKNGEPMIVIGPDCKKKYFILYRDIYYMFTIFSRIFILTVLYRTLELFKFLYKIYRCFDIFII